MTKFSLFEGSWQKVLIRVVLLLLVLYVIYRIFKALYIVAFKNKTSKEYTEFINNELPSVPTTDNSINGDPDTISNNQAKLIADGLQSNMSGYGTDEQAMFNALQCLNGASLKKVYAEFGQRNYDGVNMDLFGWFSGELSNTLFSTMIYYNDCVPSCTTYANQCRDLTYMRAIWTKSGMQLTF